jgi:hypothetical protein
MAIADQQKKLSKLVKWEGAEVRQLWVPLLEAAKQIFLADYEAPIFRGPYSAAEKKKLNEAFQLMHDQAVMEPEPATVIELMPNRGSDYASGAWWIQNLAAATGLSEKDVEAAVQAQYKVWLSGKTPKSPSAWMMAQFAKPDPKAKSPAKPAGQSSSADVDKYEDDAASSPVPWILLAAGAGVAGIWWYSRRKG